MTARNERRLAAAAGAAGALLRAVKTTAPGIVGAVAVCWGCALIWAPLAFLAAGAFLLLLDRRLS